MGVKMSRWIIGCATLAKAALVVLAQTPEPQLPRPGAVIVQEVIGEATMVAGDQRKPIKPAERLRVGATIETERMSIVTLILSNGALLRIGSESELEVEEFGQATVPGSPKFAELKEEPTVSRTRLRLVRGDVWIEVKPLNTSRGSSFMLSMITGTVRSVNGTFHARVRMSDLGLGVCTIELEKGAADFERVGGTFVPLQVGRQVAMAIEIERTTGVVKVSDMPKETPKEAPKETSAK
jgi:hypothetical protein